MNYIKCIAVSFLPTKMRIALGHQSRAGKDTAANLLVDIIQHQTNRKILRMSFADLLYKIAATMQRQLGQPAEKCPKLLQLLGQGMRDVYGADIWSAKVAESIDAANSSTHIIVTDVRYSNEAAALRERGFIMVKVVRLDRPIDRDQTHPSEIELCEYDWDFSLDNNGDFDDLRRNCEALYRSCMLKPRSQNNVHACLDAAKFGREYISDDNIGTMHSSFAGQSPYGNITDPLSPQSDPHEFSSMNPSRV